MIPKFIDTILAVIVNRLLSCRHLLFTVILLMKREDRPYKQIKERCEHSNLITLLKFYLLKEAKKVRNSLITFCC
jgi:hypothetical protein